MNFTKHVKLKKEKFGAVIFDTLREKVFVTNETGSRIAVLIEEGKEMEEIAALLSEEYSARHEEIDSGLRDFLDRMRKEELLA